MILELVRSATAEPWDLRRAAAGLRSKQHSVPALRVALSRVNLARADGVKGPIPDRCAATLAEVLAGRLGAVAHARVPVGVGSE